MEAQIAALCDSANDYNGKLVVVGTFDTIFARDFPVVHPQCALALRLCFRKEDEGAHKLKIALTKKDGGEVIQPFEPSVEVKFPDGGVPFVTRNVILNLQRLKFEESGEYNIEVGVDSKKLVSLPLLVAQVRAKGAEGEESKKD